MNATRLSSNVARPKFEHYQDVRNVLGLQSESALIEGLTALRNQLTIRHSESITPIDGRLVLVTVWAESDSGLHGLFELWDGVNTRQTRLLCVVLSVFSAVLGILSSQLAHHHLCVPVVRSLLSPQWSSKLSTYLATSQHDLILSTLKLYLALSNFAAGRECKSVLDCFPWGLKSLPKLLGMRRRSRPAGDDDILSRPDIRTLYVTFLLSFVKPGIPTVAKTGFLEQHHGHFGALFRGLAQDPYSLVRTVLETCWVGIWRDVKIKRISKLAVFNERILEQITRLYERSVAENDDREEIPADLAHHFLLAICTHPGVGVCFRDQGWYPRAAGDDNLVHGETTADYHAGRIHNKILANLVRLLRVSEDARQQELALRILEACPELVASYWSTAALALEPRLSSRWIANVSFVGSVVSLPVPCSSFLLEAGSQLYRPHPPALSTVLDNILPISNMKSHLSRGLQSPSPLVQHCTALTLAKCLNKFDHVIAAMRGAQKALEEDEEVGLWSSRCREVENEILRRVPDFQVVVALAGQRLLQGAERTPLDPVFLLSEVAHRLLWLYYRNFPHLVAEARFKAVKLLSGVIHGQTSTGAIRGLNSLRQLHILRLLAASDDLTLTGKAGPTSESLASLLNLYVYGGSETARTAVRAILTRTLAQTLLFRHDPEEVVLWLRCLPRGRGNLRAGYAGSSTAGTDVEVVISFFVDCVQRCLKTPYDYAQRLDSLSTREQGNSSLLRSSQLNSAPSPVIMTVVEDFETKLNADLLSHEEHLPIALFVRKLVLTLASKVLDLEPLFAIGRCLAGIRMELAPSDLATAIENHIRAISHGLAQLQNPVQSVEGFNPVIQACIETFGSDTPARWPLLALEHMSVEQFCTFVDVTRKSDVASLMHLLECATPGNGHVWNYIIRHPDVRHHLDGALLLLHASEEVLSNELYRRVIVDAQPGKESPFSDTKRLLMFINHRMAASQLDSVLRDLIYLLVELIARHHHLPNASVDVLVEAVWQLPAIVKFSRKSLSSTILPAFQGLIKGSCCVIGQGRGLAIQDCIEHWVSKTRRQPVGLGDDEVQTTVVWMNAMSEAQLLGLLGDLCGASHMGDLRILTGLCSALLQTLPPGDFAALSHRLSQLRQLKLALPGVPAVQELLSISARTSLPLGYDGLLRGDDNGRRISALVPTSLKRWQLSLSQHGDNLDTGSLLGQAEWTEHDISFLVTAIYKNKLTRLPVARSLALRDTSKWRVDDIASLIHALADTGTLADAQCATDRLAIASHYERIYSHLQDASISAASRRVCDHALRSLIRLPEVLQRAIFPILAEAHRTRRRHKPPIYLLRLLIDSPAGCGGVVKTAEDLIETGLKDVVAALSNNGDLDEDARMLVRLLTAAFTGPYHRMIRDGEMLVGAAIHHRLQDAEVLSLAHSVLSKADFKPSVVNRFLQAIIRHPQFYAAAQAEGACDLAVRGRLVGVLHRLFNLHPINTCHPSHVAPLLKIYGGSMSAEDNLLFSVFKLCERTKNISVAALLSRWSATHGVESNEPLASVLSFDSVRMFNTCLQFPQHMEPEETLSFEGDQHLYNPYFVVLLFAQMLANSSRYSAADWVHVFRTNVVCLIMRSMSARSRSLRDMATALLAKLWQRLQDADIQESTNVLYLLCLLKNTSKPGLAADGPERLPAYVTLLFAYALRGVFYSSNFTYPLTTRFLLQRPQFDIDDIPLLYSTLFGASDQWRKERAWIVRFMADSTVGREEWKILRRRHTWDLLASLFSREPVGTELRRGILELLANLTCERHAATSLVSRSALLSWLELHLQHARPDEGKACLMIMSNILSTADLPRLEAQTNGRWLPAFVRCLLVFLEQRTCDYSSFVQLVHIIRLLSSSPLALSSQVETLVRRAVRHLEGLERSGIGGLIPAAGISAPKLAHVTSLHRSDSLWKEEEGDEIVVWGTCVEWLWSATMTLPVNCVEWGLLTARLMVWHAIAGSSSATAEWARRQVICNIVESS